MSGECGEVVEIFQWKGELETNPDGIHLSQEEIVHIGEEIADVFIYSTRLSDICNIDLAEAVTFKLQPETHNSLVRPNENEWRSVPLDQLTASIQDMKATFRSQRHVCFALQSSVGRLCEVFGRNGERDCAVGLPAWSDADLQELSGHLGTIGALLACVADLSGVSLSQCITDKFAKNARKYPADMARGSSAKYTEYAEAVSEASAT